MWVFVGVGVGVGGWMDGWMWMDTAREEDGRVVNENHTLLPIPVADRHA